MYWKWKKNYKTTLWYWTDQRPCVRTMFNDRTQCVRECRTTTAHAHTLQYWSNETAEPYYFIKLKNYFNENVSDNRIQNHDIAQAHNATVVNKLAACQPSPRNLARTRITAAFTGTCRPIRIRDAAAMYAMEEKNSRTR